jgi:hypothetical protein
VSLAAREHTCSEVNQKAAWKSYDVVGLSTSPQQSANTRYERRGVYGFPEEVVSAAI